MKWCLKIIFIFFVAILQAQPSKPDGTPLAKSDLVKKKKVSDFAPAFPKGSVIQQYEFLYHAGGKILICTGTSNTLSEKCTNAMETVDFGSNLYLDVLYRIGSKSFADTRRYKIEKR